VASRSLDDVGAWSNSTLLRGDLAAEVRRRRAVQDVMVTGSGSVVDQLVVRDLVDQYRLLVFPVVLSKGRRLFDAAISPVELGVGIGGGCWPRHPAAGARPPPGLRGRSCATPC
jgi:dihydrofolate reductase